MDLGEQSFGLNTNRLGKQPTWDEKMGRKPELNTFTNINAIHLKDIASRKTLLENKRLDQGKKVSNLDQSLGTATYSQYIHFKTMHT